MVDEDEGVPHVEGHRSAFGSERIGRLREKLWRRAFSPLDAFIFEKAIAPAVSRIIGPLVSSLVGGTQVLDVGCGGGMIARSVAESSRCNVLGVDPSTSQVRRFNRHRRERPEVRAIRGRADALPFSTGAFDSLYSSCTWKHWPDAARAAAECARVVRSGGAIIVVEIDRAGTKDDWRRFVSAGRVPRGLRKMVIWFTLLMVAPVGPCATSLGASFDGLPVSPPKVSKLGDLPFLVCTTTVL